MKRKLREKKSKTFGTKQVLTQINKSAHEEEHRTPTGTSPTVATFGAQYKWGTGV